MPFWLIYILFSLLVGSISTYGMIQSDKVEFCWKIKPIFEAIGIALAIAVLRPLILFCLITGG